MAKVVYEVMYSDAGGQQRHALVLGHEGEPSGGETLNKLLVWQGADGWQERTSVPHGSAEQGATWY